MAAIDLDRLKDAMARAELDQSALARAVGCTAGAINQIVLGHTQRSRYLPDIADRLGVSLRWLRRLDDAPQDFVPPAPSNGPPSPAPLMLPVTLPSETALADMFEGMLLAIDREQSLDAVARELAQLLPTGLSTLQGRLLELPRPPRAPGPPAFPGPAAPAAAKAPAHAGREYQR